MMYLSKIEGIFSSTKTPYCMAIGDFNGDPSWSITHDAIPHLFGKTLAEFCNSEQLIISDHVEMDPDTYTYVSSSGATSWLDHIISTVNLHNLITDVKVHCDVSVKRTTRLFW